MRKQEQLDTLLLFTPHVPASVQAGGWTARRQIAFIAALARTGVVRTAAASVGMSTSSAYQLRPRVRLHTHNLADAPMTPAQAAALGPSYIYSFARAWHRALDEARCEAIDAIRARGFGPVRRNSRTSVAAIDARIWFGGRRAHAWMS